MYLNDVASKCNFEEVHDFRSDRRGARANHDNVTTKDILDLQKASLVSMFSSTCGSIKKRSVPCGKQGGPREHECCHQ
jgi:hypothetical protein